MDIVILDGHMGGGDLDGLPTLKRILALYADRGLPVPPVVILSGEADPAVSADMSAAGAAQVVLKPAKAEALRGLRQLAVAHRAAQRTARRSAVMSSGGGGGGNGRNGSADVAEGSEGEEAC